MEYERLTEIRNGEVIDNCKNCPNLHNPQGCTEKICNEIKKNRLAELEDMIESGQAVVLQCKAGEFVYAAYKHLDNVIYGKVVYITINSDVTYIIEDNKGKTYWAEHVYKDKEAAEAKLKELRGE